MPDRASASPSPRRKNPPAAKEMPTIIAPTIALKLNMVQSFIMGMMLLMFTESFAKKIGILDLSAPEGKAGKKWKPPSDAYVAN